MRGDARFRTPPPSIRWIADSYDKWADKCCAAGYDPIEQAIRARQYGGRRVSAVRAPTVAELSPSADRPAVVGHNDREIER